MMTEYYFYGYFIFFIILGSCVGSFLNIIIYRTPIILRNKWDKEIGLLNDNTHDLDIKKYNLFIPCSSCPHCQKKIPLIYNIPILGWLYLRGKSKCCNNKISLHYPIVEMLTAILTVLIMMNYNDGWRQLAALLLTWSLVVLAFIDLNEKILPDCITLPLLCGGLLLNLNHMFSSLHSAVIGSVLGYLFFWLTYWFMKMLTGKETMGYGDFKLMAALGAWFGWEVIPLLTFISSSLGIIYYITLRLFKKEMKQSIAFGPFLAISGVTFLFFQQNLNYFLY
ncbi:A24 family peptidase [Candidatus Fukatsuia symbiotica]|nr:A24 family peptidase [Candidatus Fukatsuia symbiotica]MEA9443991.1 A24 family peptidase [Candidatus Fukatsuia symbiotica]